MVVLCRDVCKVVKDLSEEERALWRGSAAYHGHIGKDGGGEGKQRLTEQWLAKLEEHLRTLIEVIIHIKGAEGGRGQTEEG